MADPDDVDPLAGLGERLLGRREDLDGEQLDLLPEEDE